jgi:hypothetical protein
MERQSGTPVGISHFTYPSFISCLSAGDDSTHHSSILFSTHAKLTFIDSVISVDTLHSAGATGKVFSYSTHPWGLTRTGPYDVFFRLSWTT